MSKRYRLNVVGVFSERHPDLVPVDLCSGTLRSRLDLFLDGPLRVNLESVGTKVTRKIYVIRRRKERREGVRKGERGEREKEEKEREKRRKEEEDEGEEKGGGTGVERVRYR